MANFKPIRAAAAPRGFLVAARLSCLLLVTSAHLYSPAEND